MPIKRIQDLQIVDPVLTSIARGYLKQKTMLWSELLPVITVDKEVGKIRTFGKDYYRIYNSRRALQADSNVGEGTVKSKISYELEERDISLPIDYRERAESPDNLEAEYTELAMQNLMNGVEDEVATMMQTSGSYASGNAEALGSGDKFSNTSSKPVEVIGDGKSVIRGKIGIDPNLLVLSEDSYKALQNHPDLVDRIKYSQTGVLNMDLMKQFFDVENIIVAKSIKTDDTDNFVDLYNACAILLYVAPAGARSEANPSFGYTLQKKGQPVSDTWTNPNKKVDYVRATLIQKPYILSPEAGFLFTATVA